MAYHTLTLVSYKHSDPRSPVVRRYDTSGLTEAERLELLTSAKAEYLSSEGWLTTIGVDNTPDHDPVQPMLLEWGKEIQEDD